MLRIKHLLTTGMLVLVSAGCQPAAPTLPSETPIPVDAPAELTPTPDLPTPTSELPVTPAGPAPIPNVDIDGITFTLDPGVAGSWSVEHIPDQKPDNPGIVAPRHIRIDFLAYAFDEREKSAHIFMMPTYGLDKRLNEFYVQHIERLEQFLQTRPAVVEPASVPTYGIPHVMSDEYGLVQFFHAKIAYLAFQNGTGVRYLTGYSGEIISVGNFNLMYSFQGLTSDDRYVVAAYWPVSHPDLPNDVSAALEDYDAFRQNFPTYLDNVTQQLNNSAPVTFDPDLSLLDALIQSLNIEPRTDF